MTDKEVLYISTIAQCSNITKASEKLFISQPSLTQALHRIENDLGVALFSRNRKGLQLTEAGQTYLNAAKQIVGLYQQMHEEMGEVSAQMQGHLVLGITPFQGGILLPPFLAQYQKRFPKVKLSIAEGNSSQLEQMILSGQIDLAVLHSPISDYRLGYDALYREEFFLAVPASSKEHAAAGGGVPIITPKVFAKQKFVMLLSNQRVRQVTNDIFLAAYIKPKVYHTTSNLMTALGLTAHGLGATFVPQSFAFFYANNYPVKYFRFPPEWNAGWTLMIAYAQNALLSKPSLEVIRIIREIIATMPEVFK